jgi:hypothetical protein
MKKELSLATLGDINGGMFGIAVNTALAQTMRDCEDRPGLDGVRKLTLEVAFIPLMDSKGDLMGVNVLPSVKQPKLPPQKIPGQVLGVKIHRDDETKIVLGVQAVFEDPYQKTIFDSQGVSQSEERN